MRFPLLAKKVRLLVQYGSTFKHGLICEVAAPDKSNRCAALLGNLSGSLVWVVPPKKNCLREQHIFYCSIVC